MTDVVVGSVPAPPGNSRIDMNRTRSALAAMMLAVVIPAQSGGQQPASRAEYDKFVAEWTAAGKAYTAAQKELIASDAYKAALAAKDNEKLTSLRNSLVRPDAKGFGERALQLADQFAGEEGLPFLVFASNSFADETVQKGVLERAQKRHLKSKNLGDIIENAMMLSRFAGQDETRAFFDRVIAESPHQMPRAWAMYWEAMDVQRNKKASDEDKSKAAARLVEAAQLAAGTELGDRIAAPAFEKEHLQIGMEVPNIVGADLDGAAFELKDYRGKVVVLDFWGFW
jgi:hypothetical protein